MTDMIHNITPKQSLEKAKSLDLQKMLVHSKISIMRHLPYLTVLSGHVKYEFTYMKSLARVIQGPNHVPIVQINPVALGFVALVMEDKLQPTMNFFVLHELLHLAFGHFDRIGEREVKRWNIAADFTINNAIEAMERPDVFYVPNFVYKGMFLNEHAEAIYEKLKGEGDKDDEGEENDQDSDGQGGSGGGEGLPDPDNQSTLEDSSEIEQIDKKTARNVEQAVRAGLSQQRQKRKDIGQGSSDAILEIIEELLKPEIDWAGLLANKFKEIKDDDYETYNHYHFLSRDVIFPVYMSETINLSIVVDTSGSMGVEEIRRALSEIVGLINTTKANIALFSCDTETKFSGMYSFEQGDDVDTFCETLELQGGGGTDMYAGVLGAIEWAENEMFHHDAIVVISDGYIDSFKNETDQEVIFISIDNDCENLIENATYVNFRNIVK